MAEVRQRKPNATADAPNDASPDIDDDKKQKKPSPPPSTGWDTSTTSVAIAVLTILALTGAAVAAVLHFFDPLQYLDLASSSSSSSSSSTNNHQSSSLPTFTPAQLRTYDGTDPTKPIYLAINRTIHDVSAGRAFYGPPAGPYAHFAGRDASRAWVTECFGDALPASTPDDQRAAHLTHSLRGLEAMFAPLWLDEALQDAADGAPVAGDAAALFPAANVPAGTVLPEKLRRQARQAMERMPGGRVSEAEKAERRERDAVEAKELLEQALGKWVGFFGGNAAKYPVVGRVVFEEADEPAELPVLCEKARKKRPIKGGRLESVMGMMSKMMGGGAAGAGAGAGAGGDGKAQMPDYVKQMLEKREREKRENS
ncbi:hypothetical protein SLS57_004193 [Botryosphaeria dothidea]